MSSATEHNKQCVRAFYAALVSADFDTASAMCHGDFVFYGQLDTPRPGAQGFMAAEQGHLDAFAHMTMTVETLVAEGDKVAALVIVEGEHVGEYYGVQPTGRHLRMSMLNMFTFADGLIIEKRAHYDRLDHIQQLTAS
ncbi:putative ester cyclase [Nocardioides aromaticivorans]|uniref:Putative ester cyclase n=1 Tax=Nocardioides aromaticivorans TaxID=200618 RepID=A0A7Y9ZGL6_9ACTN|nr:ester cyclase [Nocardioides aromaticivorans]NYI45057.1 putative ester cyclase [Nocardioides aromaticivorans]